jgi:hypothetical protein
MSAKVSATAPAKAEAVIALGLSSVDVMFAFIALQSVDRVYNGTDPSIIAALKDWDKAVPIITRLLGFNLNDAGVWDDAVGSLDKVTQSTWNAVGHHVLKIISTDPFGALKVIFNKLDDLVDTECSVYKDQNEEHYLTGCDMAKQQHKVWTEVRDLIQRVKDLGEAGILDARRVKFSCVVTRV